MEEFEYTSGWTKKPNHAKTNSADKAKKPPVKAANKPVRDYSPARLKDLCAEDKARIGELVKRIALEKSQREELQNKTESEKKKYKQQLKSLQKENQQRLSEADELRKRVEKYSEMLEYYKNQGIAASPEPKVDTQESFSYTPNRETATSPVRDSSLNQTVYTQTLRDQEVQADVDFQPKATAVQTSTDDVPRFRSTPQQATAVQTSTENATRFQSTLQQATAVQTSTEEPARFHSTARLEAQNSPTFEEGPKFYTGTTPELSPYQNSRTPHLSPFKNSQQPKETKASLQIKSLRQDISSIYASMSKFTNSYGPSVRNSVAPSAASYSPLPDQKPSSIFQSSLNNPLLMESKQEDTRVKNLMQRVEASSKRANQLFEQKDPVRDSQSFKLTDLGYPKKAETIKVQEEVPIIDDGFYDDNLFELVEDLERMEASESSMRVDSKVLNVIEDLEEEQGYESDESYNELKNRAYNLKNSLSMGFMGSKF